jgi:DNA-binding PadR family transcriptional regulator
MGIAAGNDNSEARNQNAPAVRPLEMFLLGLVKGGLITAYDWQAKARISLGASLPAVKRLLKAGLLEEVKEGPRGRREFGLTAEGRDKVSWRNLDRYLGKALDDPPGDLESAVRLACLATIIDDVKGAEKFLLEAADAHQRRARAAKKRAASKDAFRSKLGGLYSAVLAQCEEKQARATMDKLDALRKEWVKTVKDILQLWQEERRGTR